MKLMTLTLFSFLIFACSNKDKRSESNDVPTLSGHQIVVDIINPGLNKDTVKIQDTKVDTLSTFRLRGGQFLNGNYKISKLINYQTGKKSIEFSKNTENHILTDLPNSIDVKNFSVNDIIETSDGFKIVADWGGGNYFYSREFNFTFVDDQFVLNRIIKGSFRLEDKKEEKVTIEVDPAISMYSFTILDFLQND